MPAPTPENTAVVLFAEPSAPRKIDRVPFVELFNNRLQGVVSSGSDIERVYCAFIEAGSGDYYSSTNNNRPDAGLAKRLQWLTEEAVIQFGAERVARFLQVTVDASKSKASYEIVAQATRHGRPKKEPAGAVFSRFLNYLRFLELESAARPLPELSWFVSK